MNFPVNTPAQARAVLRALRQARKSTQTQVGQLLGVNQKRIARIEAAPGRTSFDQIVQLVSALGGRIVIEAPIQSDTNKPTPKNQKAAPDRW
jgi:HTH-type transcriptional regulator/antitoxin HipB